MKRLVQGKSAEASVSRRPGKVSGGSSGRKSSAGTGAKSGARSGGVPDRKRPGGARTSRASGGVPDRKRPLKGGKPKLDALEIRRARALAILDRLRALYPDAGCELGHGSAIELLVATILSAQCTDVRVNMTTPALFARYQTAADYAAAEPAELEALIHSTGFYRNKARSIIALGKALVERHGSVVPETMEALVMLPGVGRKTANVLIAEWYHRPGIAVDTHVIRLTGPIWRLTNETDPVKIEFALYEFFDEDDRAFFGIATIFHGRRVCSARSPNCGDCRLASICPSAFKGHG